MFFSPRAYSFFCKCASVSLDCHQLPGPSPLLIRTKRFGWHSMQSYIIVAAYTCSLLDRPHEWLPHIRPEIHCRPPVRQAWGLMLPTPGICCTCTVAVLHDPSATSSTKSGELAHILRRNRRPISSAQVHILPTQLTSNIASWRGWVLPIQCWPFAPEIRHWKTSCLM